MKSGIFKSYDPAKEWGKLSDDDIRKLTPDEIELYHLATLPDAHIAFLRDEKGNDWYRWLKNLSPDKLKISYDPDSKIIIHFSFDQSAIFPINQIVTEIGIADIPPEFIKAGNSALGGAFIYQDGIIKASPVDYVEKAKVKKQQLLKEATSTISPLQDALDLGIATEIEQKRLGLWKTYRVTISRVNPELAPDIDWPSQPE